MIERRGYENRLEPTEEQNQRLLRFVGCRRWVWNWALALQIQRLEAGLPLLAFPELCKQLTEKRNSEETAWLSEGPVHTQQCALRDLTLAFQRWRQKKAGFPKFKKRGRNESMRYPDCKQIKLDPTTTDGQGRQILPTIFLPKIGSVKLRLSRPVFGKICNATVRYRAGYWFISIQTEMEISPSKIAETDENTIGGDIGLCHFLVLSDGTVIDAPSTLKNKEKALHAAQRKLSRMKKGSKNYLEQKKRIQRLYLKIASIRKDFLHKVSTTLSKNHAYVKLEDVSVNQLIKTKESDLQVPEQTRAQRADFNRRLLNVGWGMFLNFLDYKLRVRGGGLILVNPAYTSQECSVCSSVHEDNRTTRDHFHCLLCHHDEHADANAAKVIKRRAGRARFACESSCSGALP